MRPFLDGRYYGNYRAADMKGRVGFRQIINLSS